MTNRIRLELVPLVLLAAVAVLVLGSAFRDARARGRRADATALSHDTTIVRAGVVQGAVRRELVPRGAQQSVPPAELRRRVLNLRAGTYVDDILAEQDSALYRWPGHSSNALRVYIAPESPIVGWDPRYPTMAREVFDEWSEAGFPLRFAFIYDSASADIAIRWIERFPVEEGQRIGVTDRMQSSDYEIAKARVGIANHDSTGRALSVAAVGGILRHEIGHALGLNHAADQTSVMYRASATTSIAPSDRATLRLLYLVPGGSLK